MIMRRVLAVAALVSIPVAHSLLGPALFQIGGVLLSMITGSALPLVGVFLVFILLLNLGVNLAPWVLPGIL